MGERETKQVAKKVDRQREREWRDERKGMNRVIMAQCESCCRKRENG